MKPTTDDVLKWAWEIFDAQNWSDVQLARLKELTDRAAAYGAAAMQKRCVEVCDRHAASSNAAKIIVEAIRALGDGDD